MARLLLILVAALALIAAGCGGDDDPELSVATPTPDDAADDDTIEPATADTAEEPDDGSGVTDDDTEATDDESAEGDDETDETDDDTEASDAAAGGGEAVPTATQAPTTGDPDFTSASKLSTVGLDEVYFGDTPEAAAERGDIEWIGLPDEGAAPQCYTLQPGGGPEGIVFTVFDSHIERVDITDTTITTLSGAGVGSTPIELADLFGERLEETTGEAGPVLTFVPADADDQDFRIIWVTDGVAATSMRAGRVPVVLPDAPCG